MRTNPAEISLPDIHWARNHNLWKLNKIARDFSFSINYD